MFLIMFAVSICAPDWGSITDIFCLMLDCIASLIDEFGIWSNYELHTDHVSIKIYNLIFPFLYKINLWKNFEVEMIDFYENKNVF